MPCSRKAEIISVTFCSSYQTGNKSGKIPSFQYKKNNVIIIDSVDHGLRMDDFQIPNFLSPVFEPKTKQVDVSLKCIKSLSLLLRPFEVLVACSGVVWAPQIETCDTIMAINTLLVSICGTYRIHCCCMPLRTQNGIKFSFFVRTIAD